MSDFNYKDILERFMDDNNWENGENIAITKEEETYLKQEVINKFRKGEMLSSEEIRYVFEYELFPYEWGDIIDEGRHGWVVYECIFTIGENEHYMMTFWHHDDYGIEDYEAQEPIRCYLKEVKVMKWVCEEDNENRD